MKQREDDLRQRMEQAYRDFDDFYLATRAYRQKCRENEAYWQANHWAAHAGGEPGAPKPVTPVLFSTLESTLADCMKCRSL